METSGQGKRLKSKINAQPNHSLIDGITVLQALATSEKPIGGRDLARRLNLEATRTNRLLKTLAYMGIARQTASRKYTAGPGMFVLAAQSMFASGFIKTAMPSLEALRSYGLTVAMGVIWQDTVSYLYHATPDLTSVQGLGRVGVFPASNGGIGLSLLAASGDEHVEELYSERDIPGFPNINELISTLKDIRILGYTKFCVSEDPKLHTLAVTIGNPVTFSIGLSGDISKHSVSELVAALQRAAAQIEESSA